MLGIEGDTTLCAGRGGRTLLYYIVVYTWQLLGRRRRLRTLASGSLQGSGFNMGAYLGASVEERSFPPGHPHHQPPQASTTEEEQLAAWRAEWEARDPTAEAELARRMAEAYLP